MDQDWQEQRVGVWDGQREIREGLVADLVVLAALASDERLSLPVEEEDHEAPVAAQEVCPELIVDSLVVWAILRTFNVWLLLPDIELLVQSIHQRDQELVRVVLPPPLELLIDPSESALETPRIDGENRSRVPHLAHALCKGLHKVAIMTHHVIGIHLVLVRRVLFVPHLDRLSVGGDLLWVVGYPGKEVADEGRVRDTLHGRVHVASVSQVGASFCPGGFRLALLDLLASRRPPTGLEHELDEDFVASSDSRSLQRLIDLTRVERALLSNPEPILLALLILGLLVLEGRYQLALHVREQGFSTESTIPQRSRRYLAVVANALALDEDLIDLKFSDHTIRRVFAHQLIKRLHNLLLVDLSTLTCLKVL